MKLQANKDRVLGVNIHAVCRPTTYMKAFYLIILVYLDHISLHEIRYFDLHTVSTHVFICDYFVKEIERKFKISVLRFSELAFLVGL